VGELPPARGRCHHRKSVALTNGGPWVAVGLAGFVVWLVFVVTASVSLLRGRQP